MEYYSVSLREPPDKYLSSNARERLEGHKTFLCNFVELKCVLELASTTSKPCMYVCVECMDVWMYVCGGARERCGRSNELTLTTTYMYLLPCRV